MIIDARTGGPRPRHARGGGGCLCLTNLAYTYTLRSVPICSKAWCFLLRQISEQIGDNEPISTVKLCCCFYVFLLFNLTSIYRTVDLSVITVINYIHCYLTSALPYKH